MTVTCDGCGTQGETTRRLGSGRINPVNPQTRARWWSRQIVVNAQRVIQYACSPECRATVEADRA